MKKELRSHHSQKKTSEDLRVLEIPLELIDRPAESVRESIDPEYVRELADSIRENGLLQPILVVPGNGRYEVVAGDCRYLAHKIINAKTIKAIVRTLSSEDILVMRAIENLQRHDLNPIEEARTYAKLRDKFSLSIGAISRKIGRNATHISNRLGLLVLPERFQEAVGQKKMPCSVALELMKIEDAEMREYYLEYAVANGITTRVAQEWVSAWEMTTDRVKIPGVVGAVGLNPLEAVPVYMPCNFCTGPVDIRKVITLHICPECEAVIKKVRAEE